MAKWNKTLILNEIKGLSKKLGRKPVKRDNSNLFLLTRKFFGSWNNALENAGFDVKKQQKPKMPIELNKNLAYFLGLLITDGHIVFDEQYRKYKILIFNSYKEEKEMIERLIEELFHYSPSIHPRKTGFSKLMNYEIYVSSKALVKCLIEKFKIPSGAKSKTVRVPNYFFNKAADSLDTNSFIRGIIDGDGSIARSHVKIASGSKLFLKDIKELLEKVSISSGKITKEKIGDTYCLYISNMSNLKELYLKLYQNAEFFYPRKKKAWERYLNIQ